MNKNKNTLTYAVFSLTLLLSAAMMFALQPMVGKMLLPIVGGTPAGWIVAMAFFQVMLLAGYLMAHLFSKVRTRVHGIFYVLALLTGIYFLPINLSDGVGRISQNPGAAEVFLLLTFCVALPFIALSATSSTVQRLFTATGHQAAHDPYFLYAASNLGSFSGLLLYPLLIEPRLALSAQTELLTKGYLLLLLLAVICLLFTKGNKSTPEVEEAKSVQPRKKIPVKEYLYWMLLAFIPSSLLMGVTVYITTDVISVPMIWVLPLGLYLLTFIIAFGRTSFLSLERMENAHVYAVFIGIFMMYVVRFKFLATLNGIWAVLLIFFVVALTCHMKLASRRPLEENSKDLTAFYLMMSVGGAIGGVLNSFIIPYTLDTLVEFPLILIFSLLLHPSVRLHTRTGKALAALLVISLLCANTTPSKIPFDEISARFALAQVCVFILLTSLFIKAKWKYKPLALLSIMFFMLSQFVITDKHELLRLRNFYGTIRVFEKSVQDAPESEPYHIRYMQHGTTVHGLQIIEDPDLETLPTAYFTPQGPLGDIFKSYHPKEVIVIGLGVGAMHCYNAPDRHFTFIEIDKDIVTVAKEHFSYLDACQNAAAPDLIVGDGRLEMARLAEHKFDMLIIDAFSSDSIPTHLLTEEAFTQYRTRLTDDGVIVINISNRYFDLTPPIAATAKALGMEAHFAEDLSTDRPAYSRESMWMLLTPKDKMPDTLPVPRWKNAEKKETLKPWTDDYTNLLSTLKF